MGHRILVVGGGAREHALLWKLNQSVRTSGLWCAPGNAGTDSLATTVAIEPTDVDGIVRCVEHHQIDLVVIGPEAALAAGVTDRLHEVRVNVFGPTRAASRIETSKVWAKEIMSAAGVPTARSLTVTDLSNGIEALSEFAVPVVIKADGLAGGKGVVVANSRDEARMVLTAFLEDGVLGIAGRTVLVEECLRGQEVSVLALCDGKTVVPLPAACDYKRARDGDRGPNTGGMGAYAPAPVMDAAMLAMVRSTILEPTARALSDRGAPLRGVLYAGLMLTADGPKTLEFNARFGDPEAQVVLPLIKSDLVDLLAAVATGTLADLAPPELDTGATVGVVLASRGYPGPFPSDLPIKGLDNVPEDVLVFHAGTKRDARGRIETAGGRVLTVVGRGPDLATAQERAYAGARRITFRGRHLRRDIAQRETGFTATARHRGASS
ncbi:MAG: phosphoribosylamine--glycine ligase [Chloroflexota bacterium]|nr:phosphoribosylamine--glycine ligase [Chloroflexota bacterium]